MAVLETREEHGYTITIESDEDCRSPRDDASPGCALVLSHSRYNFPNDAEIVFDWFEGWAAIGAYLRREHGALVTVPVWMLDHSSITMRSGDSNPFRDPWDSGRIGTGYVTPQIWADCQGTEWTGSPEQVALARQMIAAAVQVYGEYVNGECYAYTITDAEGEQVADCCGYIGDDAVNEAAGEALAGVMKARGESVPDGN